MLFSRQLKLLRNGMFWHLISIIHAPVMSCAAYSHLRFSGIDVPVCKHAIKLLFFWSIDRCQGWKSPVVVYIHMAQCANQAEQHVLPPVCGLVFLPKNFILGINIFCYHSLDRSRHIIGTLDADQDNIFLQFSIWSRPNLGVVPLLWECDPALI